MREKQETVKVEQTTLDVAADGNSIPSISLLKRDVKDLEYDVLLGAPKVLSSEFIDIVYLEMILNPACQGRYSLQDYLILFAEYG